MQIVKKSQLQQMIDQKQDLLLIDVLPKENFQKQHIPGAINIPFKDNANFIRDVKETATSKLQSIVVYCANTQCNASNQAAQKLENEGFSNVYRFEEGVEGWFGKPASRAAA